MISANASLPSSSALAFGQESVSFTGVGLFIYPQYYLLEQLLSIFTAILPTWTLISLGWKKRFDIWNAVWVIDEHKEPEIILPVSATPLEVR